MEVSLLLLLTVSLSASQGVEAVCGEVEPSPYIVTGHSGGVPDNCVSVNNQAICGKGTVLIDGSTGPTADSVDLTSASVMNDFLKWQTMGSIEFSFESSITFGNIVLHFLSYPDENIGLPNFQLSIGTKDADFSMSGQSELSTDDRRVRSVTLNVPPSETRSGTVLTLDISFDGLSNVEQFYLSEVSIFEARDPITFQHPPSDDTVVNNPFPTTSNEITLNCTVSEMGQFDWQWKKGEQVLSSSGRGLIIRRETETTLMIFNPRYSDAGMYTCEVRRREESLDTFCDSISQQLLLEAHINSPTSVSGSSNVGSVDLTCELSGYLRVGSDAVWFKEGDCNPLQSDTKYTITTMNGSLPTQSSDGGSVPSVVSVLTINMLETGDSGKYICRDPSSGVESNTTLSVDGTVVPPPPTSTSSCVQPTGTSTSTPSPSLLPSSNSGAIAAGVTVTLILFIILIVVAIIGGLLFFRWRKIPRRFSTVAAVKVTKSQQLSPSSQNGDTKPKRRNTTENKPQRRYTADDIQWNIGIYSMVDKKKDSPPPVPPQNFDPQDIESEKPITSSPAGRRFTLSMSQTPPKLEKLRNETSYNIDFTMNPLYQKTEEESKDNIVYADLSVYAVPWLDKPTSPTLSSQSSEVIYSEALDPSLLTSSSAIVTSDDIHPYGPVYAEPQPLEKWEAPLEITASNINEERQLGIGQFGEVVLATTVGVSLKDLKLSSHDDNKNVSVQVAVKKLKPNAQKLVKTAFEKEIKFMSRLKDNNIVQLLAICISDSPFIVMEYMENGDLNQYLQQRELALSEVAEDSDELTVSVLMYMAVQIASGMCYLASLKFVHRDMATRNCLVGSNYIVKIGDFGMSRSLYDNAYYRVRGKALLPIRWMATESFYGRFSEKTDVWSFGVTMWEIFTLAKLQPYEEIDDQQMINDAIKGVGRQILSKPHGCPQNVYEVMLRCWEYEANDRADFDEVYDSLSTIYESSIM